MSDEEQRSERRGWISQLIRVRHRHGSAPEGEDLQHAAPAAPGAAEAAPEPYLELTQLCGYGESTDPELQIDEAALDALCFQNDQTARPASAKEAAQLETTSRQSKRISVPAHFYYVGSGDCYRPIDASIILPPQFGRRIASCFLHDVNDGGTAFVSREEIPAGTPVTLCLAHPENATPLIAADTIILHSKPLPKGSMIPSDYIGDPLWLHGVSLSKRDALIIYKATLDSMALNAAAGTLRHDN